MFKQQTRQLQIAFVPAIIITAKRECQASDKFHGNVICATTVLT